MSASNTDPAYPCDTQALSDIQSHMLGLVVSIMYNYGLHPANVDNHFHAAMAQSEPSAPDDQYVDQFADAPIDEPVQEHADSGYPTSLPASDKKMYVTHRRAFRDALSKGIKICAKYGDCDDDHCERFHVLPEDLCPHAGRNNYCNQLSCDKIVIKACRKGRRCADSSCSFRH
jgi:hypothetical protein